MMPAHISEAVERQQISEAIRRAKRQSVHIIRQAEEDHRASKKERHQRIMAAHTIKHAFTTEEQPPLPQEKVIRAFKDTYLYNDMCIPDGKVHYSRPTDDEMWG